VHRRRAGVSRARDAGARIFSEPKDQDCGWRANTARCDLEGRRWWFATPRAATA